MLWSADNTPRPCTSCGNQLESFAQTDSEACFCLWPVSDLVTLLISWREHGDISSHQLVSGVSSLLSKMLNFALSDVAEEDGERTGRILAKGGGMSWVTLLYLLMLEPDPEKDWRSQHQTTYFQQHCKYKGWHTGQQFIQLILRQTCDSYTYIIHEQLFQVWTRGTAKVKMSCDLTLREELYLNVTREQSRGNQAVWPAEPL